MSHPNRRGLRRVDSVLGAGAAALLACAGAVDAQPARAERDERPTIVVSANAEVAAAPDRAVVRLGAVAEGAAAAEAEQQVNRVMRDLVAAIKAKGVPERAIRTEGLSLNPVYDTPAPRAGRQPEQRIVGYRASSVVSAEVTDLAAVGGVIDAGIGAGANQLQGIVFGLRDDSAARADALRKAVADARAQAEAVAAALEMRLDGVSQVTAGSNGTVQPVPMYRMAAAEAATVVEPGEVKVSGNVTVTYFLADRAAGRGN